MDNAYCLAFRIYVDACSFPLNWKRFGWGGEHRCAVVDCQRSTCWVSQLFLQLAFRLVDRANGINRCATIMSKNDVRVYLVPADFWSLFALGVGRDLRPHPASTRK